MDGPELPIFDGSALPYAALLEKAGRRKLDAARRPWRLKRTVTFLAESAEIVAVPAESMTVAFFADLAHAGIADQAAEFQVGAGDFTADLAPARTWVFYEDVIGLQQAGLIRGGSLDCAIVLRDGQPINTRYRLDQELARHKLLDFLGDLAILGRPLNALLTARGTGHRLHHQFIETLQKGTSSHDRIAHLPLDANAIRAILPHRYPFLLVDRVVEMVEGQSIVALKCVTQNEPFFQGHFPNYPSCPASCKSKALAQTGAILGLSMTEKPRQDPSSPAPTSSNSAARSCPATS